MCLHYFRADWLEAVSGRLAAEGRYHIARKKIPSKDGPVPVRARGGGGGRGGQAWNACVARDAPAAAHALPLLPSPCGPPLAALCRA